MFEKLTSSSKRLVCILERGLNMNLRTLTAERPLLSVFTITLVLLCGVAISAEEKPIWDWDKEEIIEDW